MFYLQAYINHLLANYDDYISISVYLKVNFSLEV